MGRKKAYKIIHFAMTLGGYHDTIFETGQLNKSIKNKMASPNEPHKPNIGEILLPSPLRLSSKS